MEESEIELFLSDELEGFRSFAENYPALCPDPTLRAEKDPDLRPEYLDYLGYSPLDIAFETPELLDPTVPLRGIDLAAPFDWEASEVFRDIGDVTDVLEAVAAAPGALNPTLCEMPYREFLQSSYWAAISAYLKQFVPACANCRSVLALEVHHTHYEHRGRELDNLRCLTVLCRDCHGAEHASRQSEAEF